MIVIFYLIQQQHLVWCLVIFEVDSNSFLKDYQLTFLNLLAHPIFALTRAYLSIISLVPP